MLDEPTSGLHLADIDHLLVLLDQLVESGKSVIVIEHRQAVIAHANWMIDLGPGAGQEGGRVVLEGTLADLVAAYSTPHRTASGIVRGCGVASLRRARDRPVTAVTPRWCLAPP